MIVAPGPFRTKWVSTSRSRGAGVHYLGPYEGGAAAAQIDRLVELDGRQPGDPAKAANLIVKAAKQPSPPRRLIIGEVAMQRVHERMDSLRLDMETWRKQSAATAFDSSFTPPI